MRWPRCAAAVRLNEGPIKGSRLRGLERCSSQKSRPKWPTARISVIGLVRLGRLGRSLENRGTEV